MVRRSYKGSHSLAFVAWSVVAKGQGCCCCWVTEKRTEAWSALQQWYDEGKVTNRGPNCEVAKV